MYRMPARCPICEGELLVERLTCSQCGTSLEGSFSLERLSRLSEEQWQFVELFLRCEGKLTRVQEELGISYPTARNRLHDVLHALGYEMEEEPTAETRQQLLDDLAEGKTTVRRVLQLLTRK
ncbi:MAG TPA: DUF2089 domain-containing protein [Anaerolineae bacterium]|nr:DUF2089 domain-containing protein [Anaerolineae bacterium]HRU94661.1 DUF2089 domain-containing protein [Anaerolineae bacterium]HXK41466.1 DUF2089 domain-containing protein [Anaerolineae bacterium]